MANFNQSLLNIEDKLKKCEYDLPDWSLLDSFDDNGIEERKIDTIVPNERVESHGAFTLYNAQDVINQQLYIVNKLTEDSDTALKDIAMMRKFKLSRTNENPTGLPKVIEGPFLPFFVNKGITNGERLLCQNIQPNQLSLESFLQNVRYLNLSDRLRMILSLTSALAVLERLGQNHNALNHFSVFQVTEQKKFQIAVGNLRKHEGQFFSVKDRVFLSKLLLRFLCDFNRVSKSHRSLYSVFSEGSKTNQMWALQCDFMYSSSLLNEGKESVTQDTWREAVQVAMTMSNKSQSLILYELRHIWKKFKVTADVK